jgi:hypothetical protein
MPLLLRTVQNLLTRDAVLMRYVAEILQNISKNAANWA